MLEVKFYDEVDDELLKFAVIITRSAGKWVFCKHRERDTYEVPGGHREAGEYIDDTASRELYEETGAVEFTIKPVCVYSVVRREGDVTTETFGKLYFAEVTQFEEQLHSEIEKIILTENLVDNWTYPLIQPKLMEEARRRGVKMSKKYSGKINTYHLLEGARLARGLTVIIDVFRAFSLECYLYDMGVKEIRPVGDVEEAFALHDSIADSVLVGERHGKKCEGFDFGNSPSTVTAERVAGKCIIHTTSAGTQGIVNATGASEIITGSLVNARAVAEYIMQKNPQEVSLVCMGNGGVRPAREDELCAEYIQSILEDRELPDMDERVADLQKHGGEHFFDRTRQEVFPEADFWLCIKYNRFPFVIRIEKDEIGFVARKVCGISDEY